MEYEILDNGQVLKVEKILDSQGKIKHVVKSHFDMQYNIVLMTDKSEVLADGKDEAVLTIKIYDYLGNFQSKYSGNVEIEDGGVLRQVSVVNGKAQFSFTTDQAGDYEILARGVKMRSSKIKITARTEG